MNQFSFTHDRTNKSIGAHVSPTGQGANPTTGEKEPLAMPPREVASQEKQHPQKGAKYLKEKNQKFPPAGRGLAERRYLPKCRQTVIVQERSLDQQKKRSVKSGCGHPWSSRALVAALKGDHSSNDKGQGC